MPLELQPVTLADFDEWATYTEEAGGTLASPLVTLTWPVDTPEDGVRRNKWSMDQQRAAFQADPTVHFVKVIDTDLEPGNQTISWARWHYYPDGLPDATPLPGATLPDGDKLAPNRPEPPKGMRMDIRIAMRNLISEGHADWPLTRQKCWFLLVLVTRSGFRRRGAGSLLIRWGLDEAAKSNCVAMLDARSSAESVYAKQGFLRHAVKHSDAVNIGFTQMYKFPPSHESAS